MPSSKETSKLDMAHGWAMVAMFCLSVATWMAKGFPAALATFGLGAVVMALLYFLADADEKQAKKKR